MPYKIKRVDTDDDEIVEEIAMLHRLTFADQAPPINAEKGWWWIAFYRDDHPTDNWGVPLVPNGVSVSAAFAGLTMFDGQPQLGYLKRCGVLPAYQGNGLQRKLIRVREIQARKLGMTHIFTDTTDNPASANSLIGAGYRLWTPKNPWAWKHTLYWNKEL